MRKLSYLFIAIAIAAPQVKAQRVFSNSRTPIGGSTSYRTGTTNRWGTPAARGYQSPGARTSSPDWSLRKPTYRNSRSVTSQYDAALNGRSRGSYNSLSAAAYSYRPQRQSYSAYRGPVVYGIAPANSVYQPYPAFGGFGSPYNYGVYPYAYGPSPYVTGVVTPPITLNYNLNVPSAPNINLPPSASAVPQSVPQIDSLSVSDQISKQIPVDERPVVDEFGPAVGVQGKADVASDRIRSLRYQTSGDNYFRDGEFSSASAMYDAARKAAPDRRAPWLRLAFAQIAEQRFEDGVTSLKTALSIDDHPTDSWVNAATLYGSRNLHRGNVHNDGLWEWLQQRPNSTDRLLLSAAFQQFRGYSGVSRELLTEAKRSGLSEGIANSLEQIASENLAQRIMPATDEEPRSTPPDPGIRIHGNDGSPSIGLPVPVPSEFE